MAYSIRLEGMGADGSTVFSIGPYWWKISDLGKNIKINWVSSNDTGSYSDEDADISINEARILHEQFKPELEKLIAFNVKLLKSIKTRAEKNAASQIMLYQECITRHQSMMTLLDSAVGNEARNVSHFHVCIFEWDSGY